MQGLERTCRTWPQAAEGTPNEKEAAVSPARLALLALVFLSSALHAEHADHRREAAPPKATAKPTREQIARWIEQLGSDDFKVREEASQHLWEAGEAGEPALREAATSSDIEVRRRARELLDKFKWGLYPSTPRPLVELIDRYQSASAEGKPVVIRDLLDAGQPGCKVMLKIAAAEENAEIQKALRSRLAVELYRVFPLLLAQKDFATLEALLAVSLDEESKIGRGNAIACWLLRGQLDQKIAHYRALADRKEKARETTEMLVCLYRARGDRRMAWETARQAGRDDLVYELLDEMSDWNEKAWPETFTVTREIERLGYQAFCHRLTGNPKGFEEILTEIRKLAENLGPDEERKRFQLARVLFLNQRPDLALTLLEPSEERAQTCFEVLAEQRKYREAFALVEKAKKANSKQLPFLEILQARALTDLGETDKARAILARYGAQIRPVVADSAVPFPWAEQLIEAECRAGRKDDAFAHVAILLSMGETRRQTERLLDKLFPFQGETAESLLSLLKYLFPKDDMRGRMSRLRQLLEGKTDARDLTRWIDNTEALIQRMGGLGGDAESVEIAVHGEAWPLALAEAALACKREDLARAYLEKVGSARAWLRLGDLLAGKKEWDQSARWYYRAWEKDRKWPLPLYLSGKALVRAGQAQEGKQRMELAHVLPLGNDSIRRTFLSDLAARGHLEARRRQSELLFRLSEPGSITAWFAMQWIGLDAVQRGDNREHGREATLAASQMQRFLLRPQRADFIFRGGRPYVTGPAVASAVGAQALLLAGKVEQARPLIAAYLEATPADEFLALQIGPILSKLGLKKELDELYTRSTERDEKLCREFPRYAEAHAAPGSDRLGLPAQPGCRPGARPESGRAGPGGGRSMGHPE